MREVGGVQSLVGHDLDGRLGHELEAVENLVDVVGRALSIAQGINDHGRPPNDVAAAEDVSVDPPVGVCSDEPPLVAKALGHPIEVLHLADGNHDRVTMNLVLGSLFHPRGDIATLVLLQMRLAQHCAADHAVVSEDASACRIGLELDTLFLCLLEVLGDDEQLVGGLKRHDRDLLGPKAEGRASRVGGGVATADHEYLLSDLDGAVESGLSQELEPAHDAAQVVTLDRQLASHVLPDGDECSVEILEVVPRDVLADARVVLDLDVTEIFDLGDFLVEDVLGEMPVRDATTHHPAGLREGLEYRHAIAEPSGVVSARESSRTRADDGDALAVDGRNRVRDRIFCQLEAEVPEEAFDVANPDGLVVILAIAGSFTGVVADASGNRWHWVVFDDGHVAVEETLVLDVVEIPLDLFPGWTRVVAGRRLVPVDGAEEAEVAGGEQLLARLLGGCRCDACKR